MCGSTPLHLLNKKNRELMAALINSNFHKTFISSSRIKLSSDNGFIRSVSNKNSFEKNQIVRYTRMRKAIKKLEAVPSKDGVVPVEEDDGVSLGTLKLPGNTDLARFEILLFQWANSLCQGANLPLPIPLKVDRIQGGTRLGFVDIDEGRTRVMVYIDCVVSQAKDGSGPMFRASRNGLLKAEAPPGEPRIMRSLLQALQKCVEIARL